MVLMGLLLSGCTSENAPDCLQDSGNLIRDDVVLPNFSKITVFENVSLVLKQGDVQMVAVETGEALRNEVVAEVVENRLLLRDTNNCNFFREYGLTTVYVTSPNIDEIRSSTGWSVRSDGVLEYPNLTLLSESYIDNTSETTDGEFDISVDCQTLNVVVNGIAYFKIGGDAVNLNLDIAAGDSRIEAEELVAQNISLNHRGSNNMIVNPLVSLEGTIRGTGDVISLNRPGQVDVEELYKGKLIFR